MMKQFSKRHKWGEAKRNTFTTVQKCEDCGLYRFKALGIWLYSEEEVTDKNPFRETIENMGCNPERTNTYEQ